jgi:gluconokinase
MTDKPAFIVVMGVSGCGKSTIAPRLAERLHWRSADADSFHPQSNVDKMSIGTPLTDADREPWLRAIADWMEQNRRSGGCAVIACSALKRSYRDILAGGRRDVMFVYLEGEFDLIEQRLAARSGHFMPTAMLASQFAALETPQADEPVMIVSIVARPDEIVSSIMTQLAQSADQRS